MAKVRFEVVSPLKPDDIVAALIDFSGRRPELWPAIDPAVYEVHEVTETSAVVTEGTDFMGGIWARELYEWSDSGPIRATIQDSNMWHPGGTWELAAAARPEGGTTITVVRDRRAKNTKGRALEAMMRLVGRSVLAKELMKAPAINGQTEPSGKE